MGRIVDALLVPLILAIIQFIHMKLDNNENYNKLINHKLILPIAITIFVIQILVIVLKNIGGFY